MKEQSCFSHAHPARRADGCPGFPTEGVLSALMRPCPATAAPPGYLQLRRLPCSFSLEEPLELTYWPPHTLLFQPWDLTPQIGQHPSVPTPSSPCSSSLRHLASHASQGRGCIVPPGTRLRADLSWELWIFVTARCQSRKVSGVTPVSHPCNAEPRPVCVNWLWKELLTPSLLCTRGPLSLRLVLRGLCSLVRHRGGDVTLSMHSLSPSARAVTAGPFPPSLEGNCPARRRANCLAAGMSDPLGTLAARDSHAALRRVCCCSWLHPPAFLLLLVMGGGVPGFLLPSPAQPSGPGNRPSCPWPKQLGDPAGGAA
ncbi:uncharacterized protein LOC122463318 [Chelonia mydas]|uniref:uncharacterized protein LOC122463318 n=1 Tax=Chelonia mydas TaxID=8469 RepID=UPI001CA8EF35|nr:uncharacterized protein LOC122463318 [Chelonia mydas]